MPPPKSGLLNIIFRACTSLYESLINYQVSLDLERERESEGGGREKERLASSVWHKIQHVTQQINSQD